MSQQRMRVRVIFMGVLLLISSPAQTQTTDTQTPKPAPTLQADAGKERSTYLPYPYAGVEPHLDKGIYYNDPELQVTDIVDVQLKIGPNGEILDNPVFKPEYHKDSDITYFRLVFPTFDRTEGRLEQIKTYIEVFFGINNKRENVTCSFVKENGTTVLNRVEAEYFNQITKISKDYIFDVDFLPERVSFVNDYRKAHKLYATLRKNPLYETNLKVQEAEDCAEIKKNLGSPKFFQCDPYVNGMGFHPEEMFTVDVVLKGTMKSGILIHIIPFSEKAAEPIHADKIYRPAIKADTLMDFVLAYTKKNMPRKKILQKYLMTSLSEKEFVKRLAKFDSAIEDFVDVYKSERGLLDRTYNLKIKSLLWNRKKRQNDKDQQALANIKMFDGIAKEINEYGVKRATKKVMHDLRNLGDLKTYLIRRKRFVTEYHIQKIYEYLDYLRYLKDKKIEQRFYNGFSDD